MSDATEWIRSVLLVGAGRGFVIEVDGRRLVVTAAHCLPARQDGQALPPPDSASLLEERTYSNLLGRLGFEMTVSAECLFVDPIADIAVFGSPDSQALWKEADAYDVLVGAVVLLAIGALPFAPERFKLPNGAEIAGPPVAESEAWLLALEGHWFEDFHEGGPEPYLPANLPGWMTMAEGLLAR